MTRTGQASKRIEAVLWDLDGTLVDSEPIHGRAFRKAVRDLGLVLPDTFGPSLIGQSDDAVHALLCECGLSCDLMSWRRAKWRHYALMSGDLALRSGVQPVIDELIDLGMAMAVVSNSTREEVDLNLSSTGLCALVRFSLSRTDVAQPKPSPEGYLKAADRLGVAPSRCLVIEDSPVGARAGVAAGAKTIFHPQRPVVRTRRPDGALYLDPSGDLWTTITGVLAGRY